MLTLNRLPLLIRTNAKWKMLPPMSMAILRRKRKACACNLKPWSICKTCIIPIVYVESHSRIRKVADCMRILFVTPYPPSRIRLRAYGFLSHLRQQHEVTIVAQCASERDMADVQALRGQGYEVIEVQESRRQAVLRSGLALCSPLPLQVAYARSASFTQTVQRLCLERTYDVIHVEHLRGMASMEALARTHPLVWDAVDCISLLSKLAIKAGPSFSVRTVARLEYN